MLSNLTAETGQQNNTIRDYHEKVNSADEANLLSSSTLSSSSSIVLTVVTSMSTTTEPTLVSARHNESSLLTTISNESANFFGINDRDIPILIGAAAGAIGLLIIILAAILAWYCCQYGIRRQRSAYCLDEENEKWASCSNLGSEIFADNDSVVFTGIENLSNQNVRGHNIRRSLSAQIHMVNPNHDKQFETISALDSTNPESQRRYTNNIETNQNHSKQSENISDNTINVCDANIRSNQVNDNQLRHADQNYNNEEDEDEYNLDDKYRYNSKSQLYSEVINKNNHDIIIDGTNQRTRSLTWKKNPNEVDESTKFSNSQIKLNFTKKRANRMRNDSAAAIALNRSGETPSHSPYLTKETDCLVDNDSLIENEAVVVYDERTVL